ncbi:MFS transporter [Kibdelosporangium philippinense]|uniref:MFS transporter n=1 Tax=Kibdelosporangium philippinense TaxID=211113 RepID=A0ABS8ZRT4_9PSEU|nr:MFS transporter [Kibdelosporangium philippinense]MCE7010299.1 MFS transporter [Kibdelosporangium philippinense]
MSYRALLRAVSPAFFPLGLLARLPYAMAPLATLILLESATGSFTFAGIAGAAQCVAIAAGGPVVGALADRYGHRVVGVTAAVSNVIATLALLPASQMDRPAMFLTATLTGLTQPQVGPLVRVYWSHTAEIRLLPTALSYEAAVDETTFVLGPALVGLLTPISPVAPVVATAVLLTLATFPFALLHARPHVASAERTAQKLPRWSMTAMFLAMAAIGAVFGAVQTGVTAYADSIGQPAAAGLIYAEFGIGSALAGAACAWLPRKFKQHQRYVTFSVTLFLGTLSLLVFPVPVAIAVASITVAPYMVSLYALTERLAPPQKAAIAVTILCAGGPLGTAIGRAIAGNLADERGAEGAFLVVPITSAAALILAVAAFRHVGRRSVRGPQGLPGCAVPPSRPVSGVDRKGCGRGA